MSVAKQLGENTGAGGFPMLKKFALVVIAFACLIGLANAQDDGGSGDFSVGLGNSDGCAMGYCDTTFAPSTWDGVSQRFLDGWQPGSLQQITALDPSLADQVSQLKSDFESGIVSLAQQENTFIDNAIAGAKANPAGAIAIAADIGVPLLASEGLLFTGNVPLTEALTVGSAPFNWNSWMMGLGTSVISSSLNNKSLDETTSSALQGTSFSLDQMKAADASAVALGAVGGAMDLADQGRLVNGGHTTTLPVSAIDPAILNPIPINGVVPASLSQAFISTTAGNDTNESMDLSAIENWLTMQQMLANMNQSAAQSRSSSAAASSICPTGYAANPSAFAHMEAGLPPGANEYLCVPASTGQPGSTSSANSNAAAQRFPPTCNSQLGGNGVGFPGAVNPYCSSFNGGTQSASLSTHSPVSPQVPTSPSKTATSQVSNSANPQSSSSGLCPNPAAIATVTGPALGHSVSSHPVPIVLDA